MWRGILQQQPNNLGARYNLGVAFRDKGNIEEAMREFQKALQINPSHINSRIGAANIRLQQGQLDHAISEFNIILNIDPDNAHTYGELGSAYLYRFLQKKQKDDLGLAREAYEKSLALKPNNVDASHSTNGLAVISYHSHQLKQALEYAQVANELNPKNNAAYTSLLWMQWRVFWKSLRGGKFRDASTIMAKIIKQHRLPEPGPKIPRIG